MKCTLTVTAVKQHSIADIFMNTQGIPAQSLIIRGIYTI